MDIWIKKYFGKEDWGPLFDLFEKHFVASNGPKEMMMLKSGPVLDTTIYLRLKYDNSKIYKGFEKITVSDIPKDFSFLIGHEWERESLKEFLNKG